MTPTAPRSRVLATLALGGAVTAVNYAFCCLPLPALAQVAVGYSNPIFASAAYGVELRRARRDQTTFSVAGINVQPIDGSLIYDQNTLWQINDPQQPFSITVTEEGPRLDLRKADLTTKSAAVQRTERVFTQISGPAADALQSVFPLPTGRAEDGLSPVMPISVFAP